MKQDISGLPKLLTYFENNGITVCIIYGSAASKRYISKCDIDLSDLRTAKGFFLKEILTKGEILLNKDPEFLGKKAIEMM